MVVLISGNSLLSEDVTVGNSVFSQVELWILVDKKWQYTNFSCVILVWCILRCILQEEYSILLYIYEKIYLEA